MNALFITITLNIGLLRVQVAQADNNFSTQYGTYVRNEDNKVYLITNSSKELVYQGDARLAKLLPVGDDIYSFFPGAGIYRSPDGKNIGGGGNTINVYRGGSYVVHWMRCRLGIYTAFNGGQIYFSPDGQYLGGGGITKKVYSGSASLESLECLKGIGSDKRDIRGYLTDKYNDAVRATFTRWGTYFSPDGNNLGGGGDTVPQGGRY